MVTIPSTDFVEGKIEEFLVCFGEKMASLSEEAFKTQVTALVKLKECEDSHLGEEVDRHWFEVFTQQYVFHRLHKEVGVTHACAHACTCTHTQSHTHSQYAYIQSPTVYIQYF